MKYLQLSLGSEVLKGKEKEQTVLIEGFHRTYATKNCLRSCTEKK